VPVEANVAEIFCAITPALPMPVSTTVPGHPNTARAAAAKPSSKRSARAAIRSASMRTTLRARFRFGFASVIVPSSPPSIRQGARIIKPCGEGVKGKRRASTHAEEKLRNRKR